MKKVFFDAPSKVLYTEHRLTIHNLHWTMTAPLNYMLSINYKFNMGVFSYFVLQCFTPAEISICMLDADNCQKKKFGKNYKTLYLKFHTTGGEGLQSTLVA